MGIVALSCALRSRVRRLTVRTEQKQGHQNCAAQIADDIPAYRPLADTQLLRFAKPRRSMCAPSVGVPVRRTAEQKRREKGRYIVKRAATCCGTSLDPRVTQMKMLTCPMSP
jgi:hypothetical protein